jgi:cytochrome c oxidase subunit 2
MNSGSFWLPPAKSTLAGDTDALFHFITNASIIMFIGVIGAMLYFIFAYRRKSDSDVTPDVHHNDVLEITWSVIPFFLVMFVFGWGFKGYLIHRTIPADAYEIHVVGKKWSWEFRYANGAVSQGELHIPAGRPIKLIMRSDDVLHSFFIPEYRVKHDVVPGRYTNVWFEAMEPGDAIVFCTEYCGNSHSDMMATVKAHSEADFLAWLDSSMKIPDGVTPAEYGKTMYLKAGCNACHSIDGSKLVGPSFLGLVGRTESTNVGDVVADESYIRESIVEPNAKVVAGYQPVMPSYKSSLKDFQIDAIIEFMKGLK